ncbi:hypothetical protein MQC88_00755 [Luteimonas sp. 50]|uniref:Uncharacterized protein n=1 Tax=Cognatiluteimonas sedimenti TaxID=2927791 RepID=A0ABT0A0L0_9GAMM|nr:hypothetical protein [Lysobacter sedimenti]MCJ0824500.1 hypothetical protein [Lysobacter sedimenti]
MERHEPVLNREDQSEAAAEDWGNVRFRRLGAGGGAGSPDDNADARFWIGLLIFLLVALAYPWYSYWVNARLLASDLQAAGEVIGRQIEASNAQLRRQSMAQAARQRAATQQARIASVRVVGTIPGANGPTAIVQLEQAELTEAAATICRQTEYMLGSSLAGKALRVQRHRGSRPALDVGSIRC